MKYKYIIWDWNGTLYNDVQISIDAMNKMLEIKDYPQRLDLSSYHEKFCFPIINYYINVGFDFDKHPFDELAELFISIYAPMQGRVELFNNAIDVLDYFSSLGLSQTVISVCEKKRLVEQISPFGISQYFTEALGTDDNFAVSKVDIAKRWMSDNSINPNEVVFIGDTAHDYETARAVNCDVILVADGHQSYEALSKSGSIVVNRLEDVKRFII